MKTENYESPRLEIVLFDTESVMADNSAREPWDDMGMGEGGILE